jgi:Ca-activated chloride channel homolog
MSRAPIHAGRSVVFAGLLVLTLSLAAAYPLLVREREWLAVTWRHPFVLLALALVPLLLWRGTLGEDLRIPSLRLGALGPLGKGPRGIRVWLRDLPGILRAVAVMGFVLALARPVNTLRAAVDDEEGIDIQLVLDLSGSMEAVIDDLPSDLKHFVPDKPHRGLRPTRLDAAKAVIRDFISRRKSDRIGVVVFGKAAYVLSPPTLDYHLLDALVSRMDLTLIDGGATAIGDAVGTAVARLRKSHAESKIVILLTDGDNNAGRVDPEQAAHLATVVGAQVHTIQIGDGEVAEALEGFDLFGQPRYVQKNYPVNPELLRTIAESTGGRSYIATDARSLRAHLHDVLDRFEKSRFESNVATHEELFRLLLLPAVLLLALEALLRAFVMRRFP